MTTTAYGSHRRRCRNSAFCIFFFALLPFFLESVDGFAATANKGFGATGGGKRRPKKSSKKKKKRAVSINNQAKPTPINNRDDIIELQDGSGLCIQKIRLTKDYSLNVFVPPNQIEDADLSNADLSLFASASGKEGKSRQALLEKKAMGMPPFVSVRERAIGHGSHLHS